MMPAQNPEELVHLVRLGVVGPREDLIALGADHLPDLAHQILFGGETPGAQILRQIVGVGVVEELPEPGRLGQKRLLLAVLDPPRREGSVKKSDPIDGALAIVRGFSERVEALLLLPIENMRRGVFREFHATAPVSPAFATGSFRTRSTKSFRLEFLSENGRSRSACHRMASVMVNSSAPRGAQQSPHSEERSCSWK